MVIELNKNPLLDNTERYRAAGLSPEFIREMAKAVSALQAAGYEPYEQLYPACCYTDFRHDCMPKSD